MATLYIGTVTHEMPRPSKAPKRRFPHIQPKFHQGDWTWRARITVEGRQKTGTIRATQEQAYEDAKELREAADARRQFARQKSTLGLALEEIEKRERTRREASNVRRDFDYRKKWLLSCWDESTLIESLTAREIDWMVTEALRVGRSVPTIRKYLQLLRRCFKTLELTMPEVDLPRQRRKSMDFFTQAEVIDILRRMREDKSADKTERDVAIATFVALTGVRSGEFLRLTTKDVDLERRVISIESKDAGNPRLVPITDALMPSVRTLLEHALRSGHFLPSLNAWNLMWARWKKRLDITVNGRLLRRSFITHAGYSGLPLADVRDLAGHRHSSTTDIYMQAVSSRLHEAASRGQMSLENEPASESAQDSEGSDQ